MLVGIHRRLAPLLLLAALVLLLAGCVRPGLIDVVALYDQGRWDEAAALVTSPDEVKRKNRDLVLWRLEEGKILHDLNRFEESLSAFEAAEALMKDYDLQAQISISEETGAVLTDQSRRDYRGTMADKTLMHCYMAMNWLALGNLEEANVQGNKMILRLEEAEQYFARQTARAEADAASRGFDLNGSMQSGQFAAHYSYLSTPSVAQFQNGFAFYLSSLCLAAAGRYDDARVDMEKVAGMAPDNAQLAAEADLLRRAAAGEPYPQRVFVIIEHGQGPRLQSVDIPMFTPWTGLSQYSFPTLVFLPRRVAGLLALDESGRVLGESRYVASLESLAAADFKRRLPGIISRTILGAAVKEGMTYAARHQMREQYGDEGELGALILMSLYKLHFSRADLRAWSTIGKETQAIHLDRPADGRLRLRILGGADLPPLDLPDDPVVFVFVRAMNAQSVSWLVAGSRTSAEGRTGLHLTREVTHP